MPNIEMNFASGGGASSADKVSFDNTVAQLPNNPSDVQNAIEELMSLDYMEETIVGTWGGKKLYRKATEQTVTLTAEAIDVPFNNPYYMNMVGLSASFSYSMFGGGNNPVPSLAMNSQWYLDIADVTSTKFGLHSGTSWRGETGTIFVTFYYTKE